MQKVKASVDIIAESTKKKANEPKKTAEEQRAANQQFHKKHQGQLARHRGNGMFLKNKRREQAAQLLAEDRHTDKKIAELCGVSLGSITKWKTRPEVKARIAELIQIFADKALKEGLAQRDRRVAVLFQLHEKLRQIVDERAADPEMASIPGGKTGLVVRQMKGIGKGKEFRLVEQFQADTKLAKEMRACGEQIARELGQWKDRVEVEDVGLAERLARARQRKPTEATTEQPVAVIETEHEIPPTDWPN